MFSQTLNTGFRIIYYATLRSWLATDNPVTLLKVARHGGHVPFCGCKHCNVIAVKASEKRTLQLAV